MKAGKDKVISLHYTLTVDGEKVESSLDRNEPLWVLLGHGQLIPGLEKALEDHEAGENLQVEVAAAEGYGERQPGMTQRVPKKYFQQAAKLKPGMTTVLALGAFLIQVMVQGAWGVVPTHLNELAPEGMRGTLPGFAYQTGNLLAAVTANAQLWIARQHGGLAFAMSVWMAAVAVLLAFLAWVGPEARGARFGRSPPGTGE